MARDNILGTNNEEGAKLKNLKWLSLVEMEMSMLKEVKEPSDPVLPDDHRLDILPEPLQRLYTITTALALAASHAQVDAGVGDQAAKKRATELYLKAHALAHIFTVETYEHFGWDVGEKPADMLPPFIRGLMGLPPE